MIYGIDALACYRYSRIVKKDFKNQGIGIFWDTFGNAERLILELARSKKHPLIRVQGIWQNSHVFTQADADKAVRIGMKVNAIAKKAQCIIYYSPFCEHRQSKKFMEELFGRLKIHSSQLVLVNSPISGGSYIDTDTTTINELHHNSRASGNLGKYGFSFDGLHCFDADMEKFKKDNKNAEYFFIWALHNNLTISHKLKKPIKDRKYKFDSKMAKSQVSLLSDKLQSKVPKNFIWKSHAEQHHDIDERANKPVVLYSTKGTLELRAGGEIIAKSLYGGKHESYHVYRFNKWGFQYFKQSEKLGASGIVEVLLNKEVIATLDPRFRHGTYINQEK